MIFIKPEYRKHFEKYRTLKDFFAITGPVARETHNRKVMQFHLGGESFYIKLHFGLGWAEIFKNWLTGRQPVYGAKTEWDALIRLKTIGVPSLEPVAFGVVGKNPANRRSFLVTKDLGKLPDMREYTKDWPQNPPHPGEKRQLIKQVAAMAKKMHAAGINHRDFYICHFMMKAKAQPESGWPQFELFLIDLHRAQTRARVPWRWLVKDMGSIYFSALDIGLTQRDFLRFQYFYSGKTVSHWSAKDRKFWQQAKAKARKIYKRDFCREPEFPF